MQKEKPNPKCKNCNHPKESHSLRSKRCNELIEVTCYQDGHWEGGYCTCSKFVEDKSSSKKEGKKMEIICAGCGKVVNENKNIRGTLRHPYCKKCFKKEFDDDYSKYNEFLMFQHG